MDIIKEYFRQSKTGLYGLLLVTPLFVIYEISVHFANLRFRNGADALATNLLRTVPVLAPITLKLLLILLLAFALYFHSERRSVNAKFIPVILLESVVYSLLLGVAASQLIQPFFKLPFLAGPAFWFPTSFISSIGAGLYEELLFRLFLFGGLFWLGRRLFRNTTSAAVPAALVASLLFSGYHYLGEYGAPFEMYSFAFRAAAGLILTVIYIYRGFAVAVYTHLFYDLWVLGLF